MKDVMGLMKQMGQMQAKMAKAQEELDKIEVEGQSGGGLVRIVLDGKGVLRRIAIDPSLMKPDETEILEDLILAATADARAKADEAMKTKMSEMTAGLPIPPGMKLF